jgi:hypothetical protein
MQLDINPDWMSFMYYLPTHQLAPAQARPRRRADLRHLGDAARHRPVMRWYTPAFLRLSQRMAIMVMITAYLLWAYGEHDGWMRY